MAFISLFFRFAVIFYFNFRVWDLAFLQQAYSDRLFNFQLYSMLAMNIVIE